MGSQYPPIDDLVRFEVPLEDVATSVGGAHGIEAAARVWFSSHAADLRVDQAALLVGLSRSSGV